MRSVIGRRRPVRLLVAVVVPAIVGCSSGSHPARPSPAASPRGARPPSVTQAGGAVSVFPVPGTQVASPQSEISIRGAAKASVGRVTVVGSKTGRHDGALVAHRDGRGASFVPARPFAPGEVVTVTTRLAVRGADDGRFRFSVARPVTETLVPRPKPTKPDLVTTFRSRPDLRLTTVRVTARSPRAAPGLVFFAPRRGVGQNGLEILDGAGDVVWFRPLSGTLQAADFRVQQYAGRPVLTWWEGQLGRGHGNGHGVIADERYRRIATVRAGNGYAADLHEFELTSAGTALVTAYRLVRRDLSSVGGPRNGVAIDCVVQEVEIGGGRVLFEWHSLGSVPLAESYQRAPDDPAEPFDFFHVNSIATDDAGNLLVSARATHAVYQIDGRTARIRWRLGGKRSDFRLGAGVRFHSQHDATWIDAATLGIFDNGAGVGGGDEKRSRGIVLHLDVRGRRATLAKELPQPDGKLFASQGNVERLANGNFFVGWGEGPYATEFAPNGDVVFALRFMSGQSYRAYRFPWTGRPATQPSVVAARSGDGVSVAVSWNGATEVARWQVLAGADVSSLAEAASAARTGFETEVRVAGAPRYVAVRALDAHGDPIVTGKPVAVAPG